MRLAAAIALVTALTAVASGAAAAPAAADDQAVYDAYTSRTGDLRRLALAYRRHHRAWVESGRRHPGAALRDVRRTQVVLLELRRAIGAEQPSSDDGARAQSAVLEALKLRYHSFRYLRRYLRARSHGELRQAARERRRWLSLGTRSIRVEDAALAAFEEAGVTTH